MTHWHRNCPLTNSRLDISEFTVSIFVNELPLEISGVLRDNFLGLMSGKPQASHEASGALLFFRSARPQVLPSCSVVGLREWVIPARKVADYEQPIFKLACSTIAQ